MQTHKVKRIYYTILAIYITWTFIGAYLFSTYGTPKVMVLVVANLNNVGLGFTAFFILRNNLRYLPEPLRPRWINRIGIYFCGTFYLGIAALVFYQKQWPIILELLGAVNRCHLRCLIYREESPSCRGQPAEWAKRCRLQ